MNTKHKYAMTGFIFILPSLAGVIIFYIYPFINTIFYCFTRNINDNVQFVWFDNFVEILKSEAFILALKNTLIFNGISVSLILLISFLLSYLLSVYPNKFSFFKTASIMPYVLPTASLVIVWQLIFDEKGVLNGLLAGLGQDGVKWLESKYSIVIVILIYLWKNLGYNIILFLAGLSNIPSEYYESAKIDGAGHIKCIFKITLPLLMPSTVFVTLISIINSLRIFKEMYLLTGNYPYKDIYMLQHFMNNNFFNLNYQRLATAGLLFACAIMVVILILLGVERYFIKKHV